MNVNTIQELPPAEPGDKEAVCPPPVVRISRTHTLGEHTDQLQVEINNSGSALPTPGDLIVLVDTVLKQILDDLKPKTQYSVTVVNQARPTADGPADTEPAPGGKDECVLCGATGGELTRDGDVAEAARELVGEEALVCTDQDGCAERLRADRAAAEEEITGGLAAAGEDLGDAVQSRQSSPQTCAGGC